MGPLGEELLEIGDYEPHDLPALHALDRICFAGDIAYSRMELLSLVEYPGSITRVARLEGKIAGFVIGRIDAPPEAHVLTLDVRPDMRRRKIGLTLMNVLHREFRLTGAKISVLEVDFRNEAARRFYEELNYHYLEVLPGYYNGRSDAWRMICRL